MAPAPQIPLGPAAAGAAPAGDKGRGNHLRPHPDPHPRGGLQAPPGSSRAPHRAPRGRRRPRSGRRRRTRRLRPLPTGVWLPEPRPPHHLLADGTVRTYFAAAPDYPFEDRAPAAPPAPISSPRAGPDLWPPHQPPPPQMPMPTPMQMPPHEAKRRHPADQDDGFLRRPKQPRRTAPQSHSTAAAHARVDRHALRGAFLKYARCSTKAPSRDGATSRAVVFRASPVAGFYSVYLVAKMVCTLSRQISLRMQGANGLTIRYAY
ncbi:hypothetical protein HU200_003935 [Digitaria exilis]|uniref:Uncharacterized protein n=1 Tax=Digitaria exilis TaxID=1010633 RepID=A0A835KTX8_9POAL|nr:hypothetical protein HU200_003935 [Digitaria exilis]